MVCQAIEPTRSRLCYSLRRRRGYLYSTILVFEYGRISHPTFVFNINVEDNVSFEVLSDYNTNETFIALRCADRVCKIRNKRVINQDRRVS